MHKSPEIHVRNLTMAYGEHVVMRNLSFDIASGSVFVIMGGSGCGKSTLLKHLIGLLEPAEGEIHYGDFNFTQADEDARKDFLRRVGVLYQGGALWSSMTLGENVAMPLEQYSSLGKKAIAELVEYKLSLVGLGGYSHYYPNEISGGMRKRAGLARAMALDPELLFFDEPSAGLDPVTSRRLDELILELRESLGTTIVVVTHELPSIFTIADQGVFLDAKTRQMGALGHPGTLLETSRDPSLLQFLTRGEQGQSESKNPR